MGTLDTRQIIDFAQADDASEFRDELYANIHDRVMSHIEDKKHEIAQEMFKKDSSEQSEAFKPYKIKSRSTYDGYRTRSHSGRDRAYDADGGANDERHDLDDNKPHDKKNDKNDKKNESSEIQVSDAILESYANMSHAAKELVLHGDSDHHLQYSSHEPIMNHLRRKAKAGTYDSKKAADLWQYHADRSAQSYHKQHGTTAQPWHKMFPQSDRKQAAQHWEELHRDSIHDRAIHTIG